MINLFLNHRPIDIVGSKSLGDLRIELAKKNRALQLSVESLKTKAAKAAEFALKLKGERDESEASLT